MKKIPTILGYSVISLLVLSIILFTAFAQRDIPVVQLKEKYCTSASRFMPLMGMQVHYRDEGPINDSIPLVLIHGTSSSLNTWDSLASELNSSIPGKRIIRMDMPPIEMLIGGIEAFIISWLIGACIAGVYNVSLYKKS